MGRYEEPEFLPWEGRRVPLTFVAGYLGSGKTTLINEVLASANRPIAVFVNDVGEINLDARLIRRRHGDTIELTDGCVCCSLNEGFGAAFDQLRARAIPPDHLIVELSGVADPGRVLPWGRSAGFRLDGVITMVDAEHFGARLADPVTAHIVTTQIEAADIVILTKTEQIDPLKAAEVSSGVEELATAVPIVASGTSAAASLLSLGSRHGAGTTELPEPTLFDRHSAELMPVPDPIGMDDLNRLLDTLPPDTVRAKGIAASPTGARWLIQIVGGRRSITKLPAAEDEPPTDLVVITLP
ncbi:MAG: GTP-binding protein, partial [Actinobacteria bacterium]|nr:GTP-binding protein [Actinomycetota bacterium]